ncbi:hypothetical protein [Sphingobacterium paucimobilis]|uniref:Uncharacterized protein n=1 Tax=Sphingobacterium paucimobilis HER1398 TaxID=1346330 RepID=U2JBV9_9SPHI|nr:hypothetical protein [Sphingobacterium paucimobilis]ERJ60133.1 hypothetical protein M472_15315 [Sphingobacterium paucimobilis HER1398]
MKVFLILITIFLSLNSYCQTDLNEGMTYDKNTKLFYKINNDNENLYINIYKDEYALKVMMQGGMLFFINTEGKKDTTSVPMIQYPIYKKPRNLEVLRVAKLENIPEVEMSVVNEYGILAESKFDLKENLEDFHINKAVFSSSLCIPLSSLGLESRGTIAIMIFLKGWRNVAIPAGGRSPILNSLSMNSSPSTDALSLEADTWSETWISYELK